MNVIGKPNGSMPTTNARATKTTTTTTTTTRTTTTTTSTPVKTSTTTPSETKTTKTTTTKSKKAAAAAAAPTPPKKAVSADSNSDSNGAGNSKSDDPNNQTALENVLDEAVKVRERTQVRIKKEQDELERLFLRGPKKLHRETKEEFDDRIAKLEYQRTIVSMPLAQEREILRQIYRASKAKRQVIEFENHGKSIREKKVLITALRDNVRYLSTKISDLRTKVSTVKTANKLGCKVEDLLGMKLICPEDKMGSIIGKHGKNVKQLMEKQNISVDFERRNGGASSKKSSSSTSDIRMLGPISSLDNALFDLEKVIGTVEDSFDISEDLLTYITAKNITVLPDMRQRHPDVYFDLVRKSNQIKVRGCPADNQSLKTDLIEDMNITKKEITVEDSLSAVIIGKQGLTIDRLVISHQTSINIERKKDDGISVITVLGPASNVCGAIEEIEETITANKETEETVPINPNAKGALLLNGGAGIQIIHKKVNEITKDSDTGASRYVAVNFTGDNCVTVKGKAKDVRLALPVVSDEIVKAESMIRKLDVDPVVIPIIIGKGGVGIKKLKEGKAVNVELDSKTGTVVLCGLDKAEVDAMVAGIKEIAAEHIVSKIKIDSVTYRLQIRDFLRTKAKECNDVIKKMSADDEKSEITLRGTDEDIKAVSTIIDEYFDKHYCEEMDVTTDEKSALLIGGKDSKIASLAAENEVRLQSDRERNMIIATGEKVKVVAAIKAIQTFLHGGEGVTVQKISLDPQQVGIVIGKGGKTKANFVKKYETVSIVVHQNENYIVLRGPEATVEECRVEIMKLVLTARLTRTIRITEKQREVLNNARINRRLNQTIPVSLTIEDDTVTLRGVNADIVEAEAIIKEEIHPKNIYDCYIELDESLFRCVKDTCRDPSHLKRIEKESGGARVSLAASEGRILFSGKRNKVKAAKEKAMTFLEFLLGSNLMRINMPISMQSSVGKASTLAEVRAVSGASVTLDRDIGAVLVVASDPSKVDNAFELLQPKMKESEKLSFEIQLKASEDWLIAAVIGRSGNRVRGLRKQTECNIEVDSKLRRICVNGDDEEKVAKAHSSIEELLDTERKQCAFVNIPDEEKPAFVGRAGAHIKEFSEKHEVEIQMLKGTASLVATVRINGKEDAVLAAKKAVDEWLAARRANRDEAQGTESVQLRRDQIPAIIGTKGSTILGLQREFNCRIDIDRETSTVTVSGGGGTAKRKAAIDKMKIIASGEDQEPETAEGDQKSDDTQETKTETSDEDVPAKTTRRQNSPSTTATNRTRQSSPSSSRSAVSRHQKVPKTDEESEFPSLRRSTSGGTKTESEPPAADDNDDDDDAMEVQKENILNGPSWASVVTVHPRQKTNAVSTVSSFDDDGIPIEIEGLPNEGDLLATEDEENENKGRHAGHMYESKSMNSDDGMADELEALHEITAKVKAALDASLEA